MLARGRNRATSSSHCGAWKPLHHGLTMATSLSNPHTPQLPAGSPSPLPPTDRRLVKRHRTSGGVRSPHRPRGSCSYRAVLLEAPPDTDPPPTVRSPLRPPKPATVCVREICCRSRSSMCVCLILYCLGMGMDRREKIKPLMSFSVDVSEDGDSRAQ